MTDRKDFLIEIGTEELPPKALSKLSDAFTDGIIDRLKKAGLEFSEYKKFAAPRRLSVLVKSLEVNQADQEIDRKGPAIKAAYDNEGKPTKAAEGFARSCGTTVDQLDKLETDKGSWLFYKVLQKGKSATELLPGIVQESLDALPIPKRMRWGDNKTEFVRPVHWILALLGDAILETEILGIKSSNITRGHRFHAPEGLEISEPQSYQEILESKGFVYPDYQKRMDIIKDQVEKTASELGGIAVIDDDLLVEVAGLVEYPVPIAGEFEKEFLNVPQEALISSMQDHQKYFPVVDSDNKLLPYFITISNIDSPEPEVIKKGNEKVIRPRLADAAFFWEQDKKNKLEDNVERLKSVVFQNKLGSISDKMSRVSKLAAKIASEIGVDENKAARASLLSKCDLLSDMVGEFPELQGIMGKYYAINDGEADDVSIAIEEHYLPKFAGDVLPDSDLSASVAMADRLDTLACIFGIGQLPTGDKDPFALRRAALGLIRILTEKSYELDLQELLKFAIDNVPVDLQKEETFNTINGFVMDRLRGYYVDRDITVNIFEAVLSCKPTKLNDFENRVNACKEFADNPASESLAAANKRIRNILKKVEIEVSVVDESLLSEEAEKALYKELQDALSDVNPLFANRSYAEALSRLASLKDVVDAFFDNVMVMVDDEKVKMNRIALLNGINTAFMQVADVSLLD